MKSIRLLLLTTLALTLSPIPIAHADIDYPPQVKTIVEQRCMVCHGCYDAPCQLKLDAWAGLQRGASKDKVYDGTRLLTANMTRLFVDANTTAQWREKGFYPVLDEDRTGKNTVQSMLDLKQQHPLPAGDRLPDSFDLGLDRDQQCPKPGEFDSFARDYPLWGMPYGLPALGNEEHDALSAWLDKGAPGVPRPLKSAALRSEITRWEAFFNGQNLKQQLVSRYIFEHLFVGNLYFSDLGEPSGYYTMVRSSTPSGEPIDVIATRRPYDSPGQDRFYYRLQPLRTSVLDKRHMPYALNQARMQRWHELFLESDYKVTALPTYKPSVASNPFVAFRELPIQSRYKFMLDEAQFTIMGFIKGPVCRGQVALNVIDDHFWVAFSNPDELSPDENAEFLAQEHNDLRLPSGKSGLLVSLWDWRGYARAQLRYLKAKSEFIARQLGTRDTKVTLDVIWNGDGHNPNAALTVFRHNDSASVVKGFVGKEPKTAWVIDYSLLERIHYLLVAGFDVFGNVGHQLESRLYMDFLRMEGEHNFLMFLPPDTRVELANFWYRDAGSHVKEYVLGENMDIEAHTDIRYQTDNPKKELLGWLRQRTYGASAHQYRVTDPKLTRLQSLTGKPFSLMPEVAFLDVLHRDGRSNVYSLIHNSSYSNNAQLFKESARRIPVEDSLTIVEGFIGSYPNMFFQVREDELERFTSDIVKLSNEQDYAALVSRYGVRRTSTWFWRLSDKLHTHYQQEYPVKAGLFDLNRYENR